MKAHALRSTLYVLLFLVGLAWRPAWSSAPVILVVGDSLSAGFGIELSESWVNLLEQRLAKSGFRQRVINASISGDTTHGGVARLPAALQRYQPAIVILELGGNDGLRALPLQGMKKNLSAMIEMSRRAGAEVLLAGMRIPPNYGPRYSEKFHAVFVDIARQYDLPLVPFFLQGVAGDPALMQNDGIHPTGRAQPRILDNVWAVLKPLLEESSQRASAGRD